MKGDGKGSWRDVPVSAAFRRLQGDALLPPPKLSAGGGAGDSVDWRAGRDKARRSIISPELSIGGMKEIRWKRVGDGTLWAFLVALGALGLQSAFRHSMEGRSVAPSGIIRRGGKRDAVD